jgi:hypothetical protein
MSYFVYIIRNRVIVTLRVNIDFTPGLLYLLKVQILKHSEVETCVHKFDNFLYNL